MQATLNLSPVVHSPSAYLDFRPRLLARPDWFTESDTKAVLSAIKLAKSFSQGLRQRERWLYYVDDRLVVYGVLGMGSYFSNEMTHELVKENGIEVQRRENDAFVGFAGLRGTLANEKFVPRRDRELHRATYKALIGPRWRERQSDSSWDQPTLTHPQPIAADPTPQGEPGMFSSDAEVVVFHPYADDDRAWRAGSANGCNVLLGLTTMDDIRTSMFAVVTAGDTTRRTERRVEPAVSGAKATAAATPTGAQGSAPASAGTRSTGTRSKASGDSPPDNPWRLPGEDDRPSPKRLKCGEGATKVMAVAITVVVAVTTVVLIANRI